MTKPIRQIGVVTAALQNIDSQIEAERTAAADAAAATAARAAAAASPRLGLGFDDGDADLLDDSPGRKALRESAPEGAPDPKKVNAAAAHGVASCP